MSSASPPYPYYDGIPYNPSFFNHEVVQQTSSGGGLTEAEANALYLRKTVPDIAMVQETFNSGIVTSSITNTTGNMTISPAAAGASLLIGNATTTTDVQIATINGRANHLHLGDGNNNFAGGGVHINNGTNNASNVNILNGATTSGNCNILSGATTTGQLNVLTTAGSTGTINLGNANSTTNLNGTTSITNLSSNKMNALTATAAQTVGANLTTGGSLTLGAAGVNTKVNGTLVANTIDANGTVSQTMNIGHNLTGTSTFPNTVNIAKNINSGEINLGTGFDVGTQNINIGSATSITNIYGITNVSQIEPIIGPDAQIFIAGTQTGGELDIGGSDLRAAGINIYGIGSIPENYTTTIGHPFPTDGTHTRNITKIKSSDVYINAEIATNNTKTVTIGNTDGLFDTTTDMKGKTYISKLFTNGITASSTNANLTIGSNMNGLGAIQIGTTGSNTTINGTTKADLSTNSTAITQVAGTSNTTIATTAYVNGQGFIGSSGLAAYAPLAGTNTFSGTSNTFNNNTLCDAYQSKTLTGTQSIMTSKTSGQIDIGNTGVINNLRGTTNISNLGTPLTPTYTVAPTSTQIGFTEVLPDETSVSIVLYGGQRTWRWFVVSQGTYIVSGSIVPTVTLNFFKLSFCALKVTPTGAGYDINTVAAADKAFSDSGATNYSAGLAATDRMSICTTIYVPAGWTSIAFVNNCFTAGTPTSTIKTAITLTRIA